MALKAALSGLTGLKIASGGLTVTSGGITVTSGDLTMSAGDIDFTTAALNADAQISSALQRGSCYARRRRPACEHQQQRP